MIARFVPFASLVPALLLLGACNDEPVVNGYGSTTPRLERPELDNVTLGDVEAPVRIGELGPNFAACNAQGRIDERAADGPVPVRAGPFEQSHEADRLAPGASFYICTRSLDQRWMGVVYADGGRADRSCGVSAPVRSRRDYDGPCRSGWVPSAQVRMTSGVETPAVQPSQNIVQPK